ncbi:MAG TPA: riboflavin biosynthesis protein RibF [Thermomicrobiales bacterium]|nr:riboflavin biosynthesis protein RibF [Thermomicrobiales bacterium]
MADPLQLLRQPVDSPRVATIGTFDGVHRGHRALVAHARERAEHVSLPLTVITFDPPPAAVLRPDAFPGTIAPLARKVELLRDAGADEVIVLPFTQELAHVTAEAFMDVLVSARVIELYTGEGFALGYKRMGTVDVLTRLSEERGIRFEAIRRIEGERGVVSSSEIRRAIVRGDAAEAASMLGHWFRVAGEVIHGEQVGRQIGYPTANVLPPESMVQLADGIYATLAHLEGEAGPLASMTYIGTRPALNTGRRLIETHVLDFDGDLYGQSLAVDFVERLRADATFPTVEELVSQLRRDEAQTRAVLASDLSPIRA